MYTTYKTDIGNLLLVAKNGFITNVDFIDEPTSVTLNNEFNRKDSEILKECNLELELYFSGKLLNFDVPIKLEGTNFQLKVWNELLKINYGVCINYGELALRIGSSKACRAVGGANHVNPIAIIVPCHRVIGKNGSLTGYAGGLWRKEWILNFEKNVIAGGKNG